MCISSNTSYANSCDAIPKERLPDDAPDELALILSDHTDQGYAVQYPDAVDPD